jgi:hypothetical protein
MKAKLKAATAQDTFVANALKRAHGAVLVSKFLHLEFFCPASDFETFRASVIEPSEQFTPCYASNDSPLSLK